MESPGSISSVSFYIRGKNLDPDVVSSRLGKIPDMSQRNGDKEVGRDGRVYIRNIGIWSIKTPDHMKDGSLPDCLDYVLSKLNFDNSDIINIEGVEEYYIDVFFVSDQDEEGGGICKFEISESQLKIISRVGAPVKFTISVA